MSSDGAALTGLILGTSSILAGTFFVNWAVDHRVIWQSPTEASVKAAVEYYLDALEGPTWLRTVLAVIAAVAVAACLAKLSKGTTSRILFDGGSLFLLLAATVIYAQNITTSFKTISELPRSTSGSESLPASAFGAISQIASAHAVIAVTLTGVVALQGAQYYSERQIQKEISKDLKTIQQAQNQNQQQQPQQKQKQAPTAAANSGARAPASPVKGSSSSSATGLAVPSNSQANLRRSPRKK